ncbi:hypothetical protein E2562_026888 [Oryza meyeriana var. granulata]|uniref:Uncharacterized protein n=1 Tax=Oryza meyeriana var. granulata TaxID=110450 RepID=A0A6G1EPL5_9ORYZ|nr:hypothetical protein E2562_026888 [Oryza meyeriana var. granulata]
MGPHSVPRQLNAERLGGEGGPGGGFAMARAEWAVQRHSVCRCGGCDGKPIGRIGGEVEKRRMGDEDRAVVVGQVGLAASRG